jgi:AraC family transcriptional activator of pobA
MRPPIVRFGSSGSAAGSLRIYRRESAPWPYHAARMHGHRFFVLNYYNRGGGAVRFPAVTVAVAAGDVLITEPGTLHDTTGIAHMRGWVVEFTGDVAGVAFGGRRFHDPALARVPPAARPGWEERFERLEREAQGGELDAREAIRALLALVLIDFARLLSSARRPRAASPLVKEVLQTIEHRHAEPRLSLARIARAVGRSPSHVTAAVRAETGLTVLEWLTERRMAEARRRLDETDEDVAIIGERVGYLDPAYFARRFRAAHGVSPRGYRKAGRR